MREFDQEVIDKIQELLNIGIALSAEKNHKLLLEKILSEARRITHCDAGTLFFLEEGQLHFKIIQNDTLKIQKGGRGETVDLPPVDVVESTVSGYCAIRKKILNIPDVYRADHEGIDFSGPKLYDAMTGYRTQSMLVMPLENYEGVVIGVLQLINAKEDSGKVVPFTSMYEKVISSLASQAAVSITNMRFVEELNATFHAFVEVISTAIDARSPYNAHHTKSIAELAEKWAVHENEHSERYKGYFDEGRIDQLVMAAWLHDIGKVAIPLEVMDKPTRLACRVDLLMARLETIREKRKVDRLEAAIQNGDLQTVVIKALSEIDGEMDEVQSFLLKANDPATFIDESIQKRLEALSERTWTKGDVKIRWIEPAELEALMVTRGTLTDEERCIIESHVTITKKMLDKIPFNEKFKYVKMWAPAHHELLDGTGYPDHLKAEEIPLEIRMLTVLDIYDALTASDRPYKKAMPSEKAFFILEDMADKNKLDKDLVQSFKMSGVWMKE